jgi:hypothetical protein
MSKSLYKTLGCKTALGPVVTENNCCGQDSSNGNGSTAGNFQQVNADWNSESGVSRILNKPPIVVPLKVLINADGTGTPNGNFDAYGAPGNTFHHDKLVGAKLAAIQMSGATAYDFGDNPVTLTDGTIDFTNVGGLQEGARLVIYFIPNPS